MIVWVLIAFCCSGTVKALSTFTYQASCSSSQYFDISQLQCISCPGNSTASSSGLNCVCNQNFYYVTNFGGGQVSCAACPSGYTTSPDGWSCVKCATPPGTSTTGACASCTSTDNIQIARDILGELLTPVTTVNSVSYATETCLACFNGTAPSTDGSRCIPCGQTISMNNSTTCSCATPVGGICFPTAALGGYTTSQLNYVVYKTNRQAATNPSVQSAWFTNNLLAAYAMCSYYRNATACQSLGNMCTLLYASRQNVGSSASVIDACSLMQVAMNTATTGVNGITNWDTAMPWIWYDSTSQVSNFLFDTAFTATFSLNQYIDIRFAMYTLNGTFLGYSMINDGVLQLCTGSTSELNAGFYFGTYFNQSCTVSVDSLFTQSLVFYDPYLYTTVNGQGQLYPIPVLLTNYYASASYPNQAAYPSYTNWQLTRRFFMVDNVSPISSTATSSTPTFVRYASSITLQLQLVSATTTGQIYVPFLSITYSDIDSTSYGQGQTVSATFAVSYYNDVSAFEYQFSIAVGVLSAVAALWAIMRTWSWSKRAGKKSVDAISLLKFFAFAAGYLANMFFVVSAGSAMYLCVFYKKQTTMYITLPSTALENYILAFLYAAFALKFIDLIHLIAVQCTIDIFFMDWEKSRFGNKQQSVVATPNPAAANAGSADQPKAVVKKVNPEVSIWRATYIANEFSELQLYRKINIKVQLMVVLIALETIGFIYVGTKDGNGSLSLAGNGVYQTPLSPLFRYALISVVWIVWGVCQWAFKSLLYERVIEDKMGMFTDLCSVANISVFIMSARQFGYYIHGRSAHGHADASLREMVEQLAKEEQGLVGHRGLTAGDDQQVYLMALPSTIRTPIDSAYSQITSRAIEGSRADAAAAAQSGDSILTPRQMKMFEMYHQLNTLLQNFIDHSITRVADYQTRKRKFIEDVLDIETDTVEGKMGYFYSDPDGNAFDAILFHGSEWTLFIFDLLLFCFVDALASSAGMQSVALDVFITWVAAQFYQLARQELGKKNIAKKTLVDSRFLA